MNIDTNGFAIGDIARDVETGYTGRIIGFTQWATGCARAALQAPVDPATNKVPDSRSTDVLSLEAVSRAVEAPIDTSKGGPRPEPVRR